MGLYSSCSPSNYSGASIAEAGVLLYNTDKL
jgi:hypothetical protein